MTHFIFLMNILSPKLSFDIPEIIPLSGFRDIPFGNVQFVSNCFGFSSTSYTGSIMLE